MDTRGIDRDTLVEVTERHGIRLSPGRVMREWAHVPASQSDRWLELETLVRETREAIGGLALHA